MRGAGSITRGAKAAAVSVHTGDHIVTLERSATAGMYRVVRVVDGKEELFTKLSGSVPEAVTQALRIYPVPTGGTSLSFAGQFDRPYLLDSSGAEVARNLSELTNVNTIFEAVRLANRRRSAAATTLKTREKDLVELVQRAGAFRTLPARLAACDHAEEAVEQAARLSDRVGRLRASVEALAVAEGVLARSSKLPEVPSFEDIQVAHQRLTRFKALLAEHADARRRETRADVDIAEASTDEAHIHDALHEALVAAGTCPTCEQPVR